MLSIFPIDEETKSFNNRHRKTISKIVFKNYAEFIESYIKDLYENNDNIENINYVKNEMNKQELFEQVYLTYKCGFRADEEYYKNTEDTFKKHVKILLDETRVEYSSTFKDSLDEIETTTLIMNTPNIVEIMKLINNN